jgi:hypothetical protein
MDLPFNSGKPIYFSVTAILIHRLPIENPDREQHAETAATSACAFGLLVHLYGRQILRYNGEQTKCDKQPGAGP